MDRQTGSKSSFDVEVSRDRLRAWLVTSGVNLPGFAAPDEQEILLALSAKKIELTDGVRRRVDEYLQLVRQACAASDAPGELPERYLIAEGQAPVEAQDGEFVWFEEFEQKLKRWDTDEQADYYSMNSILTIDAGRRIGTLRPPVDGRPGRDIFGQEIQPRRRKGMPVVLGKGLRLADEQTGEVETEIAGRLEQDGHTIYMNDVLYVPRDVDFDSGNIDAVVDVHIRGVVKPNFTVRTTRNLLIEKDVESARLEAGGDITIRRGLFGQNSGFVVRAGGSFSAHLCDEAVVEAEGDVCVAKEIINSTIRTRGKLRADNATVIGGEIHARNGAVVKHLGSEAGVPTRLAVGIDGAVLHEAQQMQSAAEKQRKAAEQIRTRISPLMANLKRLTPQQREQATELMCKADELELAIDELLEQRQQMLAAARPDEPDVAVHICGMLYPGVVIVFGLEEVVIKTATKGPLRIQRSDAQRQVLLIDERSGSQTPISTRTVDVSRFENHTEQPTGDRDGSEPRRSDS